MAGSLSAEPTRCQSGKSPAEEPVNKSQRSTQSTQRSPRIPWGFFSAASAVSVLNVVFFTRSEAGPDPCIPSRSSARPRPSSGNRSIRGGRADGSPVVRLARAFSPPERRLAARHTRRLAVMSLVFVVSRGIFASTSRNLVRRTLLVRSACGQMLTHTGQEIPGMHQERLDVFRGELEVGAVVRGLSIQERVMQPPRELLRQ
jgi:hypothetical protein